MLRKKLLILSSAILLGLGGLTVGATSYFGELNIQAHANQIYSCSLTWDVNNKPNKETLISQASRVLLKYSPDIELIEGQHVGLHNNSYFQTNGIPYDGNVGGFVNNLSNIKIDFDNTNGLLLIDVWNKNEETGAETEKETYFATQTGTVTFNQLSNNMMPNQFKIYRAKNGSNVDSVITIKSLTVVCNPVMIAPPPPIDTNSNAYQVYEDYFKNKEYKRVLNLPIEQPINRNLNYLTTNDPCVTRHYPNLMSGLLKTNEYGVLVKDLATNATENRCQIFRFDIKKDVPWMLYDGKTQYEAMVNGVKTAQYVSAQDFVTSAEAVLNYANQSQLTYLYTNFVEGAIEYNKFTYIVYQIDNGPALWKTQCGNTRGFTKKLNELIKAETGKPSNVPATDAALKAIRDFENVGVKATGVKSNGGGTIEYTLNNPNPFFVDLLSHNAFYPMNENFIKKIGRQSIGSTKEKLLYNGPFVLTDSTDKKIIYGLNKKYHDVDNVTVDKVVFKVMRNGIAPETMREEYENGNLDMFEINKNDTVGYEKYITGPNNDHDETNPINTCVSKNPLKGKEEINTLNFSRTRLVNENFQSFAESHNQFTSGDYEQIVNATNALKLNEVRKHILNSFDYVNYTEHYKKGIINTLVSENTFEDESGNDYLTNYYYKEFGQNYNLKNNTSLTYNGKGSDIDKLLKPNQEFKESVAKTRKDAIDSIIYYNLNIAKTEEEKALFPIQIEMFCPWQETSERPYFIQLITKMNQILNNMPDCTTFDRQVTLYNPELDQGGFLVIPTYEVNQINMDSVYYGGNFDICFAQNVSPLYSSPLSILDGYMEKGFYSETKAIANMANCYRLNDDKTNVIPDNVSEDISALYNNALNENDAISQKFANIAKLDYALVHKYNLTRPLGISNNNEKLVVSNLIHYHKNISCYSIQTYNLSKVAVLTKPLTKKERDMADKLYKDMTQEYHKRYGTHNIY